MARSLALTVCAARSGWGRHVADDLVQAFGGSRRRRERGSHRFGVDLLSSRRVRGQVRVMRGEEAAGCVQQAAVLVSRVRDLASSRDPREASEVSLGNLAQM